MTSPADDVIAELKALRERDASITQAAIAEALEVDQSTVSLWLSDKREPRGPARQLLRQFIATKSKVLKRGVAA